MALAITLGCETSPQEETNARKSSKPTLSVDTVPREEEPEIDGDVYLSYYKESDLPKLELTPLQTPAITQAELIRELWGESSPSNPDGFRSKRPYYQPKRPKQPGEPAEEDPPY